MESFSEIRDLALDVQSTDDCEVFNEFLGKIIKCIQNDQCPDNLCDILRNFADDHEAFETYSYYSNMKAVFDDLINMENAEYELRDYLDALSELADEIVSQYHK